ncbi:nuclear factor of activated T-cells, cytoplasmic 3 [Spea bombifrons]|uniref:nuclear factor of activated T-cells, cytoplasmic 3 n=1 Tax=Spea bombifrons TaxID=233779 RepID=UPI00234BE004|nr:nuclear factor of activated T-cells, cytoplasmic 3 [Spea bombifrons]
MSAAHCGCDEFDFKLIFGEEATEPQVPTDLEPDDCASFYLFNVDQPPSAINQAICIPRHGTHPHCSNRSPSSHFQSFKTHANDNEIPEPKYNPAGGTKAFECPSIQITSISPSCHQEIGTSEVNNQKDDYMERPSREHLYLHLEPSYREPSLSPSPGSSISSRSWFSDASSCESVSHTYDDVDFELNEAAARFTLGSPLASPSGSPRGCSGDETWQQFGYGASLSPRQSPCHSPRTSITDENWLGPRSISRPSSRPTSPCGKRRHSSADICYTDSGSPHHSPAPSPSHSPRGSITEDTWLNASQHAGSGSPPFQCSHETDIPLKTRKTSDQTATLSAKIDVCAEGPGRLSPSVETSADDNHSPQHPLKKESSTDQFLSVPSHFTWNKSKPGHVPIFRTSSLPPLDWPLPAHYGQCELKVEVQPKTHHRAHYETEGSRGAVKAASGGHPVVKLLGYADKPVNLQMFIGTADDRYIRPHAFYQVHRITGKTVATASQEIVITSTKVLEIPLLPENNMCASIDCAGILKLRNSDIELRKGETDIGRKNTRVRLVFRAHIPQANGKVLSLQTASVPVECSQRSAQELPQVENYNINSCPVTGGLEMTIAGSNFHAESKVLFFERGQDGRSQWEVEAKILVEKCQEGIIVLEIPPYYNKSLETATQVQFNLCNGKRKRSQSQRFTYLPVILKREKNEDDLPAMSSVSGENNVSALQAMSTHLPSMNQMNTHDTFLSSPTRVLTCSTQQAYSSLLGNGVPPLSHFQGRNINSPTECQSPASHQPYHVTSTSAAKLSYASMNPNIMYNGQSSLPLSATSDQGYEKLNFQQNTGVAPLVNMGHPSLPTIQYKASSSSPACALPNSIHPLAHTVPSSPHLQQAQYHCLTTGQRPIGSSSLSMSMGQPPLLHQSFSYQPPQPSSATSESSSVSLPLSHSPLSDPSSPQLQSITYLSPSLGPSFHSPSPRPITHSGQSFDHVHSPELGGKSPAPPHGHHTIQSASPFPTDDASLSVKSEPEERELNFQTIGLQDITLDDVNEIIGRDMSHGASRTSPAFHDPLESTIPDTV